MYEALIVMLYVLGMLCSFAIIVSLIRNDIKEYQSYHGTKELPPEILWCFLALIWPVPLLALGIGFAMWALIKHPVMFFYHLGMGEIDWARLPRTLKGRFWTVKAKIAREEV